MLSGVGLFWSKCMCGQLIEIVYCFIHKKQASLRLQDSSSLKLIK